MSLSEMPALRIGDLEASVPVVQGGMGVGISLSGLASAVANEGGIGVISSVGIGECEPDIKSNYKEANTRALKREIQKAREKTNGIIGVNIMVALTDFDEHVVGAVEVGADIIFMGAGLPLKLPKALPLDDLNSMKTKLVPIVSSAKAVKLILKSWKKNFDYIPDAIVVEGPLAGGHLGFKREQIEDPAYSLENIVKDVLATIQECEQAAGKQISIIAGGGIYTGADIHRFLELGVQGVQMATRFVPTHECDADIAFKQAYVNCKKEDLMIIKSPVGIPGRAIKSKFLETIEAGEKMPYKCPWKCLRTCDIKTSPFCIADALLNAQKGCIDEGFAFAGANAYRTQEIISVKQLFNDLKKEYAEAVLAHTV